MGSKTTNTTHEVQSNAPPTWAQSGLTQLGDRIAQIIPTMPGPHYDGNFIAPTNAMQQGAPGAYMDSAALAQQLVNPALGAINTAGQAPTFEGPTLGQGTQSFASYDPTAIQPVIESLMAPYMRQLQENVLPSLQSSGIESGAYGGNRMQSTLPAIAIRDAGRQMQEVATQTGFQDFTGQQNRMLQGYQLGTDRGLGTANVLTQRLGMFPDLVDTAMRMSTGSADLQAQAGQLQQSMDQQAIDNQLQQFDYNIRYPYQGLDVASALLGQIANPWGTRTTDGTQTQSTGGLAPILGGIMGLGSMVAGFPGVGGLFANAGKKG